MKITKELLLENGFEERIVEGQTIYVKGHYALVYMFCAWIPCYYAAGTVLADRIYVNTMEELSVLENL